MWQLIPVALVQQSFEEGELMGTKATIRRYLALGMLVILSFVLTSCLSTMFDQAPVAKITITAGNPYGSAPLEMTFDISGSFDPDGEIVSFTFNFGDGSTLLEGVDLSQPILHTYQQPGTFFARVEITDDKGKSSMSPQLMISPR